MTDGKRTRRAIIALGIAVAAGLIAGTVAVYVRGSGNGNDAALAANCADALATAKRIAPLATGEVAAFRVADAPEQLDDLVFKGPDGAASGLAAFKGKVVLLNLWATWCVPSPAHMPTLDRLQAAMGGDTFTVAAVNLDVRAPDRPVAFLDQIGVKNLAFYSDPTLGVLNALKRRGLAIGLPTTLLVDGRGCRIGIIEGPAGWGLPHPKGPIPAANLPG